MRSAKLAVALVLGLIAGAAVPVEGALIAYWSFDDTLANSPSNYATTGVGGWGYSTMVPWTTGGGKSLNLNGTNSLVSVAAPPTVSGTYTVSAWARVLDTNARTILGTRSPSENSFDMKFDAPGGNRRVHGDIGNGAGTWYTTAADINPFPYATGRWYHVTYVVSPNTYRIYVHDGSGSLLAANTTGSFSGATPLLSDANHQIAIGAYRVGSPGEFFNGQIDEVRIYDHALSQSDAQALAVGPTPPTGGTGPGGFERADIPSALLYWLNAGVGVVESGGAVSAWNDQTSRANNFTQATAAKQPQFVTGVLNGQPIVRFDGDMTGAGGNPAVAPNADEVILAASTSPQTVFIVNTLGTGNVGLAGIWGLNNGDQGVRRASSTAWQHPGNTADFTNPGGSAMYVNGQAFAGNATAPEGVPHILTAARASALTWAATSLGDYFQVGTVSPRPYKGDIAEVITYDRALNSAERQIVENYLSAKYNVPLAAGNVYTGDDPAKGDYDLDVFGIGRVDAANQALAAGAAGLGILALNGSMGDDEWVLAGHKTPTNSILPSGIWQRVWYVDVTGDVDAMLMFDFSDAGLAVPSGDIAPMLLYASTPALNFTAIGDPGTLDGDRVQFSLTNLESGYYTLSTAAIPEPATLSVLALGALGLAARRRRQARHATARDERSMRTLCLIVLGVLALAPLTQGGVITFSPALTTDASTAVSTGVAYTHKVAGGEAQTLNGVNFDLLNTTVTPTKFNWTTAPWTKNVVTNNSNNWNPGTGGVTGAGLIELLRDFTYSSNGISPGNYQTFTLSGLIPGTTYDTRLYIRAWDVNYTGRQITLQFTNGAEVDSQTISEDQPIAHGYANNHNAYYINYRFTAQGSTLVLDTTVAAGGGGSFHMYGLTNQFVTPPTGGTGPGGIETTGANSNLLYWLNAGAGVVESGGAVSAWNDQTARGNNFSQGTAANQPQYVPGALNGQPVVRFDGANDRLTLVTATAPQTVFIVTSPDQYVWLAGVWGSDSPVTDKGIRIDPTTGATAWRHPGDGNDFTNGTGGTMWINGTNTNNFGAYGTAHILAAYRGASSPASYGNTHLGWYYGGRVYDGDIAEVVVYDRVLNSAERRIVENALSAKYNIPLSAGNVYTGDDPAKGDYDLDVFGIGRVDAANQALAAGAAGLGILALNGSMGDDEWVLAGHKTPTNSILPSGIWERVWYIDVTGGVDAMLMFDFSDAGLALPPGQITPALLYASSPALNFTTIGDPGTLDGDRVQFSLTGLQSGYYTLSTAAIPEPATLTVLALGALGLAARRRRQPRRS